MQKFLLVQQAVFKQIRSEDEATYYWLGNVISFFCGGEGVSPLAAEIR